MPTLAELALGADVSGAIGRGLDLRRTVGALQDSDRARRSTQALDQAFAGGVPTDPAQRQSIEQQVFRTGGAAAGLQVRDLFQQMSAAERQQAVQEGRTVATFLAGVQDQGTYDRARAGLRAQGIDISSLPQQFNPAHRDFLVNSARDLEDILKSQQPGEGFTLGARQVRFDAGGNEIARGPESAAEGPDASAANQLRNAFRSDTKDFAAAQDGLAKVRAAARGGSAADDVAMIFGFMKVLDPTSVVREGEQATAQNTAGVPERIRNAYNRLLTGERLSPEQRANFSGAAERQFAALRPAYDLAVEEYSRLAPRFGLEPADVIVNRALGNAAGGAAETVQPASAAASPAAGRDISSMTLDALGALDPSTLTDAELLAAQERVQELSGAR